MTSEMVGCYRAGSLPVIWRFLSSLLFLSCLLLVDGSHFRGAIVMYRTLDNLTPDMAAKDGVRIELTYRIGWRRSYDINTYCDQSTVEGTNLIGHGAGALQCRSGCVGSLADMTFFCTDFSDTEDWSFGEVSTEVSLPYATGAGGLIQASFASGDWITLVRGGGNWEVRLKTNMTKVVTRRGANASPVSKMSPVLRLQYGCNHTIEIPVEDADGDDVRCRWASSALGECGDVCQTFPGAILEERDCTLRYSANWATGYYAVALQIEDFPDPVDTSPFSSVPLQFLVYVYTSTELCLNKPEFVPPTPGDASCIGIPHNGTFVAHLAAQSGGQELSIVDIETQSPPGMHKSGVQQVDTNTWQVNVTWTPTQAQHGPNIFCYVAHDDTQRTSEQSCITILGGVTPPSVLPATMSPTGKIIPSHQDWQIDFDRDIFRPKKEAYIEFYDDANHMVYSVDTATSPAVSFPNPGVSNTLHFQTNFLFTEKTHYYVTLDTGIATGKEFCGPESTGQFENDFWTFSVKDVTPPRITFTSNPAYTNSNITVAWTFDEDATTACILQSPGGHATTVPCGNSWNGQDLPEGYHTLFIQASDHETNSDQYQHRWYVDRTSPTVGTYHPPATYSNKTQLLLRLHCNDRSPCVYKCRNHRFGQSEDYSDCKNPVQISGLEEGENIFSAYAIDQVGNKGPSMELRWTVDVTPPQVQGLTDKAILCGDPMTPTVLGYPEVSDNTDTDPDVSYTDKSVSGCKTERVWVAKDTAGNHAFTTQTISLSDVVAPLITGESPLFVPCGNTGILFDEEQIRDALNITHVCNREMGVTYSDSRQVDACGIDLTRSWTVTDDCGKVQLFNQDIRVLHLSFPDAPQNGEVNVDIDQYLSWPQYPGATHYNVYSWLHGTAQPVTPDASMITSRYFYPLESYPPNTRIVWKVEYIVPSSDGKTQRVPSPNWEFLTRSFPDLAVTDVQIPQEAFSGASFVVSWTVENIGNVTTAASYSYFYDGIFLSLDSDAVPSRFTKSIRQTRLVDPSDGYIAEAEITLPNGETGNYFVYASTDISRYIDDYDRTNNLMRAATPLKVELTPPPNLVVNSVFTLGSTFSGQSITVRWAIINSGLGITGSASWTDVVFLSQDDELDTRDSQLATVAHNGALISGAEYQGMAQVDIPNAIYGTYFLLVQTDFRDEVYEHVGEDDNTNSASLEILLSPTPDLVVQSIDIAETASTGDTLLIQYTVKNTGAGAPFERWWNDAVMIASKSDGGVYFHTKTSFARSLLPGESYTHTLEYVIPSKMVSGNYNVSVVADDRNMVFEFDSEFNNGKWREIHVEQTLPNLAVISNALNVTESAFGNMLFVNIVVENSGRGRIVEALFEDAVFVSSSPLESPATISPISVHRQTGNIGTGESYHISSPHGITLPQLYTGTLHVYMSVDNRNQVMEQNEEDNFILIGTTELARRSADLVVSDASVDRTTAEAGSTLRVTWTVRNSGTLVSESTNWEDSLYLSHDETTDTGQVLHNTLIKLVDPFAPGSEYTQTADVAVPITSVGSLKLVVVTGQRQTGFEENLSNNLFAIDLLVNTPPLADLSVQDIVSSFVATGNPHERILAISYTATNIGNSIHDVVEWTDRIRLRDVGRKVYVETLAVRKQAIVSSDSYTATKLLTIPPHMSGYHEIIVTLDVFDDIEELYGEGNNVFRLATPVFIDEISQPTLVTSAASSQLPDGSETGDSLHIAYMVQNDGGSDLPMSSWTDAMYIHTEQGSSRQQVLASGLRVGSILQNQDLPVGGQYSTTLDVTIPYGIQGDYYIYIILDLNNKLAIPTGRQFYITLPLNIQVGPLPDLSTSFALTDTSMRSGEAIDLTFSVTNAGNATADVVWYDTLYLSDDPSVDPFDVTLKTVQSVRTLPQAESYTQTVEAFIPFDLRAPQYYILIVSNSDRRVFEDNYENNEAMQVVNIQTAPAVDLVTRSVKPSKTQAMYQEDVGVSWEVMNNGSLTASGYKCDTVYLSVDSTWDITDAALAGPTCQRFVLDANGQAADSQSYGATAVVPYVTEGSYATIVRSRNNIRDLNLDNNIGVSVQNITVLPQSISMDEKKTFQVTENSDLVLKVTGVPTGIALLVVLETSHQKAYHMLYLKRRQPPKQYEADAASEERSLTDQFVVLPVTKGGDYYLLMESMGLGKTTYSVTIEVKEAKFALTAVHPERVTPVGTATLQMTGMLFGHGLKACIQKGTSTVTLICGSHLRRYGPSTAYATFDIDGVSTGGYSVYLEDLTTGTTAELPMALFIIKDKPGKLEVRATMPGTLRAGREGLVRLNMHNSGYNDVRTPIMAVLFDGGEASVRMADSDALLPPMKCYPFIPNVDDQPIRTFPPKANRQFQVYIHSPDESRASFKVSEVGEAQLRSYVALMKGTMRPPTVNTPLWNTIWGNVDYCLGSDFESMKERLFSILEVLNKRASTRFGLMEVMNQLVLIADGKIGASAILEFTDVSHTESSLVSPLTLERSFSSALSVRRRQGPMGHGWSVPMLEIRLIIKRSGDILLEKDRVVSVFRRDSTGVYKSESLESDTITEETNTYRYTIADTMYLTFSKTGRLVAYGVPGTTEVIRLEYEEDRATKIVDSEGSKLVLVYNSQNLISSATVRTPTDQVVDEAVYTYDTEGFLRSIRKGGSLSTYEYTVEGDLSVVQYTDGYKQEISYDEQGWLSGVALYHSVELLGGTDFKLDCNGQLTVQTMPENFTAELLFGYGGVLAEFQTATGLPLSLRNNPKTLTQEVYVGDEIIHNRSFDPETRTYSETDANGDVLELKLNEDGSTLQASTSLGVLFTNNIMDGLLRDITFPDKTTEVFEYDAVGKIKERTLRDGSNVLYEFDEQDNLVRKTLNTGTVFYTYDSTRRLSEIQSEDGVTKVEYNSKGSPSKIVYPDGIELIYSYNDKNLRTSLSTNSGYQVFYNYDSHNRLISVEDGARQTLATFSYDRNGKLQNRSTGSGISTLYSFEEKSLRLKNISVSLADGSILSSYAYKYDGKGYLSSTDTTDGSWSYQYDAMGQLTQWQSPFGQGETISYDANLNRVTKTIKGRTSETYGTNNINQVTKFASRATFTYDQNGNMAEKTHQGRGKEGFTFDQEGRVTLTENTSRRCDYQYNAFGSMSKKSCTDGTVVTYVVDPFGPFGSDVLSETTGGGTTSMYYALDQGLVAQKDDTLDKLEYFVFDGDGSVTHTVSDSGDVLGNFVYDPFGNQIRGPSNDKHFGYLGQLGVSKWDDAANMFLMRARVYDAEHGRFISSDPLGPTGEQRNLYIYAKNNPLAFKDPSGEVAHIVAGTLIGGATGAVASAGWQALGIVMGGGSWSDFSWSKVGGAAVSGAITGAAVTSGAILATGGAALAGSAVTAGGGFVGGFAGSATTDLLNGDPVNYREAGISGAINAPAALVPWKMLGYKGKGGAGFGSKTQFRSPKFLTNLKTALGLGKNKAHAKTLWKSLFAGANVGEFASFLANQYRNGWAGVKKWLDDVGDTIGDWYDDASQRLDDLGDDLGNLWDRFQDNLSRWGDDFGNWFQDWIRSMDPNDITGPTGYGDGNFIAPGIDMDYRIRFENEENATAPAQRVTVVCPLDESLDPTTFRLGSFGFGDFEIELDYSTPIFQQMVNVSDEAGTLVYFQAGVDILNKEGFWLFQTIDPSTGLPPTDPTMGFLPPNNKTTASGEGFVKFRIQQRSDVPHGAVINEQASIVFDENAPIETPAIFSTLDRTWPTVSMSVNQKLTDGNGIVVSLTLADTGSGFRDVDIFTVSPSDDVTPLLSNINQSTISLPVDAGVRHKVIVVTTDNVGNVKPLDTADYTDVFYEVACLGNCSGNGVCQPNGQCQCLSGFYGDACASNQTILDPPILEFSYRAAFEDQLLTFYISARASTPSAGDTLTISLTGYPEDVTFSKGVVQDTSLVISEGQFGDVEMTLPGDFSGDVTLSATAVLMSGELRVIREEAFTLSVAPVADRPTLYASVICHQQSTKLDIQASSTDVDGSESIVIHVTGIPEFIRISGSTIQDGSVDLAPGEHIMVADEVFEVFSINVTAVAMETNGPDTHAVFKVVDVLYCGTKGTTVKPVATTKKKSSASPNAQLSTVGIVFLLMVLTWLV